MTYRNENTSETDHRAMRTGPNSAPGATPIPGAASLAMNLEGPIPTADILVQGISFDFTPRVASSNGVDVAIRD